MSVLQDSYRTYTMNVLKPINIHSGDGNDMNGNISNDSFFELWIKKRVLLLYRLKVTFFRVKQKMYQAKHKLPVRGK